MKIGDRVRMTEGPFLGLQGTILSSHRRRVILAVILGSREVEIEIERDWTGVISLRRRSTPAIETSKLTQRAAG
jgi:transcription antitermination factor NusG